ncbi:MAG: hypothetical protein ACI85E_000200 [Marinomonas primoryensis]|jgi:hypothetical protein
MFSVYRRQASSRFQVKKGKVLLVDKNMFICLRIWIKTSPNDNVLDSIDTPLDYALVGGF